MFHPSTINQSSQPLHEVHIDSIGQAPVTPVTVQQEFSPENPYAHLPNKKLHIALPAMPLQNLPVSPPQTPDFLPTNADSKAALPASASYGQSMMVQQQMQYIDSLAEAGKKLQDLEVEQEKGRILFGGEGIVDLSSESSSSTPSGSPPPAYSKTVNQQAQLLPSHMQKTTNNRFVPVRQNSHTVSFADEDPKDRSRSPSPPGTPKGHPITKGFRLDKYLNYQRGMRQVEQGREKLLGLIGGSGAVTGMKLTKQDRLFGKISRPVQHSHTSALNPPTTLYTFRTTVSYFTRIPRKSKNLLAMLLCFLLLASMIFRMSVAHAEKERQFLAKRYALGLQKAFVIPEDASNYARHPSYHLNPDAVDQVRDSETMSALAAEDIAEAAQDVTFLSAPIPTSGFVFKFANKKEELAALVSFLTSTSSNALPALDPALPLDPQLVLDFDYTKAETARDDMELLTEDVFNLFPTIIIGKMRDPNHRDVLKAFSGYTLSPPPLIIEVDQRRDAQTLTPLLARLLDREDLPAVIVNGKALAGHKEIMDLQEKGEVKKALSGEGIAIKDKLVKKKKHRLVKDAERKEQERILGPQPILEDGQQVGEEVKWW